MNTNPKTLDALVTIRLPSSVLKELVEYSKQREQTISHTVRSALVSLTRLEYERDLAVKRANEAARLSAEALDLTENLQKKIAKLNEQNCILDDDRLNTINWAHSIIDEHDIAYNSVYDDPLSVIKNYIRRRTE